MNLPLSSNLRQEYSSQTHTRYHKSYQALRYVDQALALHYVDLLFYIQLNADIFPIPNSSRNSLRICSIANFSSTLIPLSSSIPVATSTSSMSIPLSSFNPVMTSSTSIHSLLPIQWANLKALWDKQKRDWIIHIGISNSTGLCNDLQ